MTIQELYDWAVREGVENCDLVVCTPDGDTTHYILPEIVTHTYQNGDKYKEVEL